MSPKHLNWWSFKAGLFYSASSFASYSTVLRALSNFSFISDRALLSTSFQKDIFLHFSIHFLAAAVACVKRPAKKTTPYLFTGDVQIAHKALSRLPCALLLSPSFITLQDRHQEWKLSMIGLAVAGSALLPPTTTISSTIMNWLDSTALTVAFCQLQDPEAIASCPSARM